MQEKSPWYLITNAVHKGRDWVASLEAKGLVGDVISIKPHAPEPSSLCAWRVATGKLNSFIGEPSTDEALDLLGWEYVNLAVMDVNAVIPPARGKEAEILTTCRGLMPAREKIATTAQELLARRTNHDVGQVVYTNICGYGQYKDSRLQAQGAVYEGARLSVSGPLLRALCHEPTLAQICEVTSGVEEETGRKFVNENSIWGLDASMLPYIVPLVAKELSINAWVKWEDGMGGEWSADADGVTPYMRRHMNKHLRGFPDRVVDHLAQLPN